MALNKSKTFSIKFVIDVNQDFRSETIVLPNFEHVLISIYTSLPLYQLYMLKLYMSCISVSNIVLSTKPLNKSWLSNQGSIYTISITPHEWLRRALVWSGKPHTRIYLFQKEKPPLYLSFPTVGRANDIYPFDCKLLVSVLSIEIKIHASQQMHSENFCSSFLDLNIENIQGGGRLDVDLSLNSVSTEYICIECNTGISGVQMPLLHMCSMACSIAAKIKEQLGVLRIQLNCWCGQIIRFGLRHWCSYRAAPTGFSLWSINIFKVLFWYTSYYIKYLFR